MPADPSISLPQDDLLNPKDKSTETVDTQLNANKRPNHSRQTQEPPSNGLACFSKKCKSFFEKNSNLFKMAMESTASYLRRLFTMPLMRGKAISFSRPEDFDAAGQPIEKSDQKEYEEKMDMIEAACNYTEKTKSLLETSIADRKDFVANRRRYAKELDWSKLAPWNDSFLGHLESTFKVFDFSDDSLMDFDEMCAMLNDYGDKTKESDRHQVFLSADTAGKGALTFNEFVTMLHSITVKSPDSYPSTIVDAFRSIDRNMARIRGLDVVQQLQAGLF